MLQVIRPVSFNCLPSVHTPYIIIGIDRLPFFLEAVDHFHATTTELSPASCVLVATYFDNFEAFWYLWLCWIMFLPVTRVSILVRLVQELLKVLDGLNVYTRVE